MQSTTRQLTCWQQISPERHSHLLACSGKLKLAQAHAQQVRAADLDAQGVGNAAEVLQVCTV